MGYYCLHRAFLKGYDTRMCACECTPYPWALVTGWRSTAPSSNREPNVSLCFDWSPPDRGPCCPSCFLVKRFPVVFCVVSPSRCSSFYCHLQESDDETSICQMLTSIDRSSRYGRQDNFSLLCVHLCMCHKRNTQY